MDGPATSLVLRLFGTLPDPRARNRSHLLSDIVTLAILATLCGSEGWEDIEEWAKAHEPWLKTFLTLHAGIPSHDTFDDVVKRLDPVAFEQCFTTWTSTLVGASRERGEAGKFVAIDGKTLRHSFDHARGAGRRSTWSAPSLRRTSWCSVSSRSIRRPTRSLPSRNCSTCLTFAAAP